MCEFCNRLASFFEGSFGYFWGIDPIRIPLKYPFRLKPAFLNMYENACLFV